MLTCPACGASPLYIIRRVCQNCGHDINRSIHENNEVVL